jgi:hypothetical protein
MIKKEVEIKTFGQHVKKAWKNIHDIKKIKDEKQDGLNENQM